MYPFSLIETLVITVMAALLGLSMPLIMQTIERLDTKYGSGVISTVFRKSRTYRFYFFMVWVSIGLMLWLPLAPEPIECFQNNWFINHSAHILAWTSLAITLAMLLMVFLKIMKYESPSDLLRIITKISPDFPGGSDKKISLLVSNEEKFNEFGTLMKYSMTVGNTPLFLNCNLVLGTCIGECRKSAKSGESVIYPDSIYNIINETLRISQRFYDELLYPSLNSPYTFLSAYFDSYGMTIISEVTLRQLWINLCQLSKSNKSEWIKGYWIYATQYADYTVAQRITKPFDLIEIEDSEMDNLDLRTISKDKIVALKQYRNFVKEADSLRIFHHMFSAYLLFQGKQDLVKWTYTYTPSSLRTLLLIPRNITEIVIELQKINENPIFLETNYSFFSEEGIETGAMMREWLIRYYILTLNEQELLYKKGITRFNIWDESMLLSRQDAQIISQHIRTIQYLNSKLYPNIEYLSSLGISEDILKQIYAHLENIENALIHVRMRSVSETHIQMDDIEAAKSILKDGIKTLAQNLNEISPVVSGDRTLYFETINLLASVSVNKQDFIYNQRRFCQNAIPSILATMNHELSLRYINLFRLTPSVKNINIDFSEVAQALAQLQLDGDTTYCILPVDTTLCAQYEKYAVTPLYGSGQPQLIIIPRSELPCVKIDPSFIPTLVDEEKDDVIFLIGKAQALLTFPSKMNFIRLIIVNSLFDGKKSELSSIRPIISYFTKDEA